MDITDKTKIPLFAVVGILPTLVGGIIWLTNIHAKASNAEEKLTRLERAIIDIAEIKKDIEFIKEAVKKSLDK
jgi:hypothetical protein